MKFLNLFAFLAATQTKRKLLISIKNGWNHRKNPQQYDQDDPREFPRYFPGDLALKHLCKIGVGYTLWNEYVLLRDKKEALIKSLKKKYASLQ